MKCPACGGWGFTGEAELVPCSACRPKTFERWAKGEYRPDAAATMDPPTDAGAEPLAVADALAKARATLTPKLSLEDPA